ncbi:alpha/beta hydrolase [Clostridium sp. CTA-19]
MRRFININGRKIECFIKGNGKKTILIMPGMGSGFHHWLDIINEVSKIATVIVVHRAGVGNSELHSNRSNTKIAAMDAYSIINDLSIEGKIILVGHSYGGACVQHFARLYPEKVESMLLVESASIYGGKQFDKLELPVSNKTGSDKVYLNLWTRYSKYTKDQLRDEIKPKLAGKQLNLPKDIQKEILEFDIRPQIYENQLSELVDIRENIINMKNDGEFPNVFTVILKRDSNYSINEMIKEGIPKLEAEQIEALWGSLVDGLKNLSNKSELKVIENSNHCINETRPDVIITEIKKLIECN